MNIVSNSNRLRAINVFFCTLLSENLYDKNVYNFTQEYICMHIYGQAPAVIKYIFSLISKH